MYKKGPSTRLPSGMALGKPMTDSLLPKKS